MGIKIVSVVGLGLSLASASIQAFDLGSDPPDGTSHFSVAKGQSPDTIKFSLTSSADFDFKFFSTDASGGPVYGSYSLYSSKSPTALYSGSYTSSVPTLFTSLDLTKGKYYFSISDYATKPVSDPVLNLDLNISLIPEPQTYAMMVAGLAVVGVNFRRRRKVL